MTNDLKEPIKIKNYVVRFHLGAESGFQSSWKLHGSAEVIYSLIQNIKPLSADPTQILAATTVIVHMVNAMIFSTFHEDLLPEKHKEAVTRAAELFGSVFKTIDIKAGDPSISSSIQHLGKRSDFFIFSCVTSL